MLPHYLIQHCKILATQGEVLEACRKLVQYNPPKESQNFQLYKVVANDLLTSEQIEAPKMLREMLLKLLSSGMGSVSIPKQLMDDRSAPATEFHRAALVAHYQSLRNVLKERQGGMELCWKISVALCRYCTEFPVDRAFYQAGMDCKDFGNINMAFFFLNRYLDIADAIDDPENAQIDGSDFMDTDIPSPYDLDLPETHYSTESQVEDIRDWVLGWSMDANVQQKMDSRSCDNCKADIYEANLTCPKCGHKHEPCAVTGYPVVKRNRVECSSCGVSANRDDWNTYLRFFKTCPWCDVPQNAKY
jgi:intraflagellar transport protein 172